MKILHYNKNTGKILGWYDENIHKRIPTPNIEVSDEGWKQALKDNANAYMDGKFVRQDFRTNEEKQKAESRKQKRDGKDYNGHKIPLTTEDAMGVMQVKMAFGAGLKETTLHFSNGTKMRVTSSTFDDFAKWFVAERAKFFED